MVLNFADCEMMEVYGWNVVDLSFLSSAISFACWFVLFYKNFFVLCFLLFLNLLSLRFNLLLKFNRIYFVNYFIVVAELNCYYFSSKLN